jgi:hypothetical protein
VAVVVLVCGVIAIQGLSTPGIARATSIIQIDPLSALAGSGDTPFTVTANGFDTNTVQILWDGSPLANVNVVDSTNITTVLPSSLLTTAGYHTVVLTDAVSGASNPVTFTVNNPAPAVSMVNPAVATAGSAFTFTIAGTGFVAGSTVSLSSVPLSVAGQTNSALTVVAPSGTFTQAGSYALTVNNALPGGGSAATTFTITAGTPADLRLEPSSVVVPAGAMQVFTAVSFDAYSNITPDPALTWGASVDAGAIIASGSTTATFQATTKPGTYPGAVWATDGNITGTADVTVTPGSLISISLSPRVVTLAVNTTRAFTAQGFDAYHNPISGLSVGWDIPSAAGVIDSSGPLTAVVRSGTVSGVYPAALSAAVNGITASASITVTPGPIFRIDVVPQLASLAIDTGQAFTATGFDAFSNTVTGLSVSWSALPAAGSITPTGPLTALFVAGTTPGSYPDGVRAAAGGVTGTADVSVFTGPAKSLVITPSVATLPVSSTVLFTATVIDKAGNPIIEPVNWLTPTGGTIVSSGAFTMLFQAGTSVGYFAQGVQAEHAFLVGTADVHVVAGPLSRLTLLPASVVLAIHGTQTFLAVGADQYGNLVPSTNVTWGVAGVAGSIISSSPMTATFRAGTHAQVYPATILATQGGAQATADVTVLPDPPSVLGLRATPGTLRTDGISTSTVGINVSDQYGNAVAVGASVTVTAACPGVCQLTPPAGTTGQGGRFTTTLTSNYRSVTQTVNSSIRVGVVVSPGVAPQGYITGALTVSGVFVPFRRYVSSYIDTVLRNHTFCTALKVTPPATVTQPTDNAYNYYRFVATTASYNFAVMNYSGVGGLYLYRVVADKCALSSTMDVVEFDSASITTAQLTQWSPAPSFTPGVTYLLLVYSTKLTPAPYTVAIQPRAGVEAVDNATAAPDGGRKGRSHTESTAPIVSFVLVPEMPWLRARRGRRSQTW